MTGTSIVKLIGQFPLVLLLLACQATILESDVGPHKEENGSNWLSFGPEQKSRYLRFTTQALDHKGFRFTATTPGLRVRKRTAGQWSFQELHPLGGRILGRTGQPGLPGFTRLVAIPQGARMQVKINEGKPVVLDGYLLYPVQQPWAPEELPPFAMNGDFYKKDATLPSNLVSVGYDSIRGGRVARIQVTTARYNPHRRKFYFYPDIEVDIRFEGGSETYIPLERRSRFLEDFYAELMPNYSLTQIALADLIHAGSIATGCDLLIITPSDFETHAERLAAGKRERGILTRVATLGDIASAQGGTTAEDIRAYIQDVYKSANLSYVLLLGDVEFIPAHYRSIHPSHGIELGTDLYYAEMDDEGYFPDLGIGRLSVDNETEAQIVVDKILAYEQDPPVSS